MDAAPTRWVTDTSPGHSARYIERFRAMAREGRDLEGEARLVDAMAPRHARVLDAGCGPGRTAGALHRMGHAVVGVDADPELIEAAGIDHPGPRYVVADLSELDLTTHGIPGPFDAVVCAGNVMPYLAPGTGGAVMARIAAHLAPDGFAVIGFGTNRGYGLDMFDADGAAAGLEREHRFATWDLRPWHDEADFAVTVLRRPAEA